MSDKTLRAAAMVRLASFTRLVSVGLFHDWQPDRLFMIWSAYLDETDPHGAPVMALGGFVAPARAWKGFDEDWASLLLVHGLEYSHATDLFSRKGQYHGWTYEQRDQFILGAHEIMNRNLRSGAGFVAVMRTDDYRAHYKNLPKPRNPPEDTMYGVLLRACVSFSLTVAVYQKHGKTKGQTINFIVENGGVNPEYARQLYGRFKKDKFGDKEIIGMLGPVVGFAEKKESAGCQAADLMLLGAIRQERAEHGAAPSDIMVSSFADVTKPVNMQDVPTFRIPTNSEVLLSLRENMFVDAALRRAWADDDIAAGKRRFLSGR